MAVFLRIGVIEAIFNNEGTVAVDNEEHAIAVITGKWMDTGLN